MKTVILAGGRGKRINEITETTNKCMTKVNGIPAIQYNLDNSIKIDVDEIIIVVGHRASDIIDNYGNNYRGKKLRYVIQEVQNGLVHAIECAKDAINGDDFILMLGDEITINSKHQAMIDEFNKGEVFALCGVLKVEDRNYIKRTYALIHGENNRIYRLIEKPRNPKSNIMGTGNCVFRNEILNYIDITPIHYQRKEKELPDLIQSAVDDGKIVKMFDICSDYVNINAMDDVKYATKLFSKGAKELG